jgi:hypothetical protein
MILKYEEYQSVEFHIIELWWISERRGWDGFFRREGTVVMMKLEDLRYRMECGRWTGRYTGRYHFSELLDLLAWLELRSWDFK